MSLVFMVKGLVGENAELFRSGISHSILGLDQAPEPMNIQFLFAKIPVFNAVNSQAQIQLPMFWLGREHRKILPQVVVRPRGLRQVSNIQHCAADNTISRAYAGASALNCCIPMLRQPRRDNRPSLVDQRLQPPGEVRSLPGPSFPVGAHPGRLRQALQAGKPRRDVTVQWCREARRFQMPPTPRAWENTKTQRRLFTGHLNCNACRRMSRDMNQVCQSHDVLLLVLDNLRFDVAAGERRIWPHRLDRL